MSESAMVCLRKKVLTNVVLYTHTHTTIRDGKLAWGSPWRKAKFRLFPRLSST